MTDLYKLAFSTLGTPNWSFDQAAMIAARHGYQGIELRLWNGEVIPANPRREVRAQIRESCHRHGIKVVGLGASTRFSAPDAAQRQQQQQELRQYLELANDLEVPLVRTFGGHVAEGHSLDETVDWVAESLSAALPTAEQEGVDLLLETHDAFCKGADAARVMARIDHPRLGMIWDIHHPFRMGESVAETWKEMGQWVKHVHIKDAVRRPDGSWQLVLLGRGEVPNYALIQLLHQKGYQGWLSVEWEKKWHPEIEEPEIAIPQHADLLRTWFAQIQKGP